MSHKCIRCGSVFQDEDASILRGCNKCGSVFFLYMKTPQDAQQIEEIQKELEAKDTTLETELAKQIEKRKEEAKKEGVGAKKEEKVKHEKRFRRIKFGIETVRIPKEGLYEINIDALMRKQPLIILEKGRVYLIHLPSAFEVEE